MKSIQVKEHGGPERMLLVESPTPQPAAGQALVRIAASGVNFIDVYIRTGLYKSDLPVTLGSEAAGTVEAVGPQVTEVAPGDRVAFVARGSYAEYAVVPSAQLVKIPDHVDFQTAAAAHESRHSGTGFGEWLCRFASLFSMPFRRVQGVFTDRHGPFHVRDFPFAAENSLPAGRP